MTVSPLTPPAPAGWNWHLLRDLAKLESGHTPSRYRPDWWGGEVPWIALPDIRKLDGKVAFETGEYTNEAGIANSSARILPAGTVCLSRTASVGFVTKMGRPMATSQDFVNWVCGSDLEPDFLLHLLIASRDYIRELSSGAVHKTVYVPTVKEFRVCCPPLAEQKRIAGILKEQLAAVERARAAAEAQLEAAKALPAAYLREVFCAEHVAAWPSRPLGEVCNIVARQVDPTLPEYRDLPHINGENIESGTCRLLWLNTAAEDGMTSGKYLFEEGNILYSKLRPYLRKVVLAPCRGVCSADMYPVEVDRTALHSEFAAWMLLSDDFTKYADEESRRARMPKLNRDQLFSWRAPLPKLDEQEAIIARLREQMKSAGDVETVCRQQLNDIEAIPAALLRAAFQGRF